MSDYSSVDTLEQPVAKEVRPSYGFAPSLVMVVNPTSTQASAIRAVRTHVMAQHINRGRRALAICGPSGGVGCSFVAANLAVALSQIGVKTLLIDADLRQPAVERMIRPPHRPVGLSGCLRSPDAPFGAGVDANIMPDLSIMYAGEPAVNAQELLGGDRFKALMNFCLREYEATIVDTPPANSSTDARRIGGVVGYGLVVMAKDKTFLKDVKTLVAELKADGCTPIGTVLNQG